MALSAKEVLQGESGSGVCANSVWFLRVIKAGNTEGSFHKRASCFRDDSRVCADSTLFLQSHKSILQFFSFLGVYLGVKSVVQG